MLSLSPSAIALEVPGDNTAQPTLNGLECGDFSYTTSYYIHHLLFYYPVVGQHIS